MATHRHEFVSKFGLKIPGIIDEELTFRQMSGISSSVQLNGDDAASPTRGSHLTRGPRQSGQIHLMQSSTRMKGKMREWINDSLNPDKPLKRHDVTIVVYGAETPRKVKHKIMLYKAFPCTWSSPSLSTEVDDLLIENLTLAFSSSSTVSDGDQNSKDEQSQPPTYPSLKLKDGDQKVQFSSQPLRLSISQGAQFSTMAGPGMERPRTNFRSPQPRLLQTTLSTDWDILTIDNSDLAKDEVYKQIDTLQSFLKVDADTQQVPPLVFEYGQRRFEGYLSNLDVEIERFATDGMPLRVRYTMNLIEVFETMSLEDSRVF